MNAMRRIFFEKDSHKDYLFLLIDDESELDQVYKVDNFTDEMGREYVYNLMGERKNLTEEKLNEHVIPLTNGNYKDFHKDDEVKTPQACIESIIDYYNFDRKLEIFIYVRSKVNP
ncbi:hypothetical protein GCM10010984_21040 [Chishuiella changwenlii]|jgi:hypothetical protein|uniref:Uncharacterized protein n=2 Tax=Chishuiella changwenlii TaxID=1434701 RepID=A0ABQ1TUI9_9FLAO|nr:hypothetical protein GCM10010984_21040 [Chishuiella changwenlii]